MFVSPPPPPPPPPPPKRLRELFRTSRIYLALPGQYRLKSYLFLFLVAFSCFHGNHFATKKNLAHFAKFLAHVLSWVKTYHHAVFQRNQPTGLTGMMVQTYRQPDRQTDRHASYQVTIVAIKQTDMHAHHTPSSYQRLVVGETQESKNKRENEASSTIVIHICMRCQGYGRVDTLFFQT